MMFSLEVKIEKTPETEALLAQIEKGTAKGLMAVALMAQSAAQESIIRGPKTGRTYKRGNVSHTASAPGEAPANDLGFLVQNIKCDMSDDRTANLRSLAPYSVCLEYGTKNMEARPFLRPAGDAMRDKSAGIISAYVKAEQR